MPNCSNCTQPILESAKFCAECGTAVGICTKCSTPLNPQIKFCPQCGAAVAASEPQCGANVDKEVERISREAATRAANEVSQVDATSHQAATNHPTSPAAAASFRTHFPNQTLLQQPTTGKLLVMKNGWSWSLFLFPQFASLTTSSLLPWGLLWWLLIFACIAIPEFSFAICFALQATIALLLAIAGNAVRLKIHIKAGWRIVNPANVSEEQVNALKAKDTAQKALAAMFAYTAVKGAAKIGTRSAGSFYDGLHGMPASTGNAAKDVAIAERKLAEAELNFRKGNGKYEKVLEAQRTLAYRKQKLYR